MNQNQHNHNLLKVIEELEDYAFIFLDVDGTIQTWNAGAEKIKGFSAPEIIGKNFRVFYTDEDRSLMKPDSLIARAKDEGRAQDEGWRVRKDGSTFWGYVIITAVRDDHGELVGFGKLTRDLTERKMAEQSYVLELKNKELEQFNYIASHDLQEPLRTVSNYIKILEEDFSEALGEEGRMHLGTIGRAATRMSALVRSLLDISRLGRTKELVVTDTKVLAEAVTSDLHDLIQKTKAKIILKDLPVVKAYETELRLLFQNLISNALKFVKAGTVPEIRISHKKLGGFHEFSVKDNGIGIEQRYYERIFQIFQRLNKDHEFSGHGIGLANCKRIAEMHGGQIWVESEVGKGSTFKFTIVDL